MPFAIAAGHELTARTGAEVLRAGGNAVDAVIASALTACVVEPIMASPLGGGFLMLHNPDGGANGGTHLLDFFGHTPRRAPDEGALDIRAIHADFGETHQVFHIGAGTVAVPGVAAGFAEAHDRYGRIKMAELASDAVCYAKQGVRMNEFQASVLQIVAPVLRASRDIEALYTKDGVLLVENDLWRNPEMGAAIEAWVQEGARFMIEGEGARALLASCEQGGALTAEDLRNYCPIWRDPLIWHGKSARLAINPPPSAGGALVVFILSLLAEADDPIAIASALSLAHEARKKIGHDRDPSKGLDLLAPDFMRAIGGKRSWAGTTHISVIDRGGMGAALTLTNGSGSGLIAAGTGMHINDMLGEPDLVPESEGVFPENTRLSSMMAPAVLFDKDRWFMLGSGGSTRIPSAIVQTLLPLIHRGADCAGALAAPRIHIEDDVNFENCFGQDIHDRLKTMFPEARVWKDRAMFFGGVNMAACHAHGHLEAAGDLRRDGAAIYEK